LKSYNVLAFFKETNLLNRSMTT